MVFAFGVVFTDVSNINTPPRLMCRPLVEHKPRNLKQVTLIGDPWNTPSSKRLSKALLIEQDSKIIRQLPEDGDVAGAQRGNLVSPR